MTRMRVWLALIITVTVCAALPRASYAEQAGSAGRRVAAASLAAGGTHACALLTDGTVHCWGNNSAGALGTSTGFGSAAENPLPQAAVPLGARATAIAAGTDHTCALLTTGTVRCWGANVNGQLGTIEGVGSVTYSPQAPVPLGGRAVAITAGGDHTCALLAIGTVRCWGYNGSGQLGSPDSTQPYLPKPAVPLGGRATAVATGMDATCALLVDGRVRCWGSNLYGQLGSTTRASTTEPNPHPMAAVPLGAKAVAVAVGHSFACAVLASGSIRCWGANDEGQLASGVNAGVSGAANPYPMPPPKLGAAAATITAGGYHACAVLVTGAVRCWGYNNFGQDGSSTNLNTSTPTPAPQPAAVLTENGTPTRTVSADAGDFFSCALTATGHVHCWGANTYGQIGSDPIAPQNWTPVPHQIALAGVRVRAATTLTAAATPSTDRQAPYSFRVSGRVRGAFAVDAATCTGRVEVRLRRGTRTLASRTAVLRGDCTWHTTLTAPADRLAHGRNRLTVVARMPATANLARASRQLTVRAVRP